MKLRFSLLTFLSGLVLSQFLSAETVNVTTWDELYDAVKGGATDITISGMITGPSRDDSYLSIGTPVTIRGAEGGGGVIFSSASKESYRTILQLSNVQGGSISGLTFTGNFANWATGVELYEGTSTISSCHFENLTDSTDFLSLEGTKTGSNVLADNCTFTNNSNCGVFMAGASSAIRNSVFSGNSSGSYSGALSLKRGGRVIGSEFRNNHVGDTSTPPDSMYGSAGGAIKTDNAYIVDSSFYGNYVAAAGQGVSTGGAIYVETLDIGPTFLEVSAKEKDVVFSGNRIGVTQLDENGAPLDGIANAIWLRQQRSQGEANEIHVNASAGKSVSFLDPVVMQVIGSKVFDPQGFIINGEAGSTGTVVFSGELYENDADLNRMSRFGAYAGIDQKDGTVVIRNKAIVGASIDSADAATAKVGAFSYVLNKGRLEITSDSRLMAGSFTVGDGSAGGGFDRGTLAVGGGAELTAGWVFINQGVVFDLDPFIDDFSSGLKVGIVDDAPNQLLFGPVYDLDGPRITLGGQLGISDTLDYNETRWAMALEFLLFDFTDEKAVAGLTGDFEGIQSLATHSSKVEGPEYANNGEWSLKWKASAEGGANDLLYAVWTPLSIPESSTAMLGLFGFGIMLTRRCRRQG